MFSKIIIQIKNELNLTIIITYLMVCILIGFNLSNIKWVTLLLILLIMLSILQIFKCKKEYKIIGYIFLAFPLFSMFLIHFVADASWKAKQFKAKMDIENITKAVLIFKDDFGFYPDVQRGLKALVEKPSSENMLTKWRKDGYLSRVDILTDPWGKEYIYIYPGINSAFDIISFGADGQLGGENEDKDITNWE